ncbi:DUF1329 domain-containing protein [Pyruvatibacter mobilis]|uniref:DUF1329 domain-containing protein n=1 Tax=Pyruvatibacter mobilis TaxID=1712261 RepID=UPI003BA95078
MSSGLRRALAALAYSTLPLLAAGAAQSAVPADMAARLDADLTPLGSERAGNADGTIPAWTGGLQSPPAGLGYQRGMHHPNPYSADQSLFTITRDNMGQYADRLTGAQKALLEKYGDTFKMNVYPSHRSCAQPDFVYEANRKNALTGIITDEGNGVDEAIMGKPFPIPNSGYEVLWNHLLGFGNHKLQRQFAAVIPTASGSYTKYSARDDAIIRWNDPAIKTAAELDNIMALYILHTLEPTRVAGNVILVHETLNRLSDPRKAWQYSPGTRRVRRAPNIAYDNPGTNSDGATTSDSFGGFNGAPDRYTWTLRGRQEAYIPYNNYELYSDKLTYDDVIRPRHLNTDHVRYELHRVWQLEANLKPSTRHVYSRRVFYQDEDSWGIVSAELYDARGELWRVQEQYPVTFYEVPVCGSSMGAAYDFTNGRYIAVGLINEEEPVNFYADHLEERRYTPQTIRTLGR